MLPAWRVAEIRKVVEDFQFLPGGYARRAQDALVALLLEREGLINALMLIEAGAHMDTPDGARDIARRTLKEEQ